MGLTPKYFCRILHISLDGVARWSPERELVRAQDFDSAKAKAQNYGFGFFQAVEAEVYTEDRSQYARFYLKEDREWV